ncbi:D-alanine--D-alanine ligase [Candidatus Desulfarcum epimagneticum]|uniref:D-alanine--D-alanine ligase n=1 Tax=uncultured Desulfobacteraceae bacterium TaxID=218296 RepID=A0A484HJ29_9BACT|nr:D-alanine--D-alanine ligase [uncultured Desulfobacteraceae bacterium]
MKKRVIALISGGISPERQVSIESGDQVFKALDKEKYTVLRYDPMTDLPRLAADAEKIDAAFIALHGRYGEDGTVQGMLDLLDIPYQGSGVLGSAMAMNKIVSKHMCQAHGVPVPPFRALKRGEPANVGEIVEELGLPLVIKPAETGSSVGISVARTPDEVGAGIDLAFSHDESILAEAHIDGVEITAAVIGNDHLETLPLIEIIPGSDSPFFDYEAKYTPGGAREICPARIEEKHAEKAREYAKTAHRALLCKGYSRTDMILKDGELYVLETNTIPGMTPTSLLPQAAAKAGISFGRLLDRLIDLGVRSRPPQTGKTV